MKTTTYKEVTEKSYPFMKFIDKADRAIVLEANEYYALMVEDTDYPNNKSPHVQGIDIDSDMPLVGIEGTSKPNCPYISKKYSTRKQSHRGSTIIVEVQPEDLNKCCLLSH